MGLVAVRRKAGSMESVSVECGQRMAPAGAVHTLVV